MLGAMQVGVWSAAGVLGPVLVNYIREYRIAHGVARADAWSLTMFVLAGLLIVRFIANLMIRPVDTRHHYRGPA